MFCWLLTFECFLDSIIRILSSDNEAHSIGVLARSVHKHLQLLMLDVSVCVVILLSREPHLRRQRAVEMSNVISVFVCLRASVTLLQVGRPIEFRRFRTATSGNDSDIVMIDMEL